MLEKVQFDEDSPTLSYAAILLQNLSLAAGATFQFYSCCNMKKKCCVACVHVTKDVAHVAGWVTSAMI